MKFSCDKAGLSEAVNSVLPAVSAKSTLAALECILLSVKGDTLSVVGYNTELGITKTVPVTGTENGEIIFKRQAFKRNHQPDAPGDAADRGRR